MYRYDQYTGHILMMRREFIGRHSFSKMSQCDNYSWSYPIQIFFSTWLNIQLSSVPYWRIKKKTQLLVWITNWKTIIYHVFTKFLLLLWATKRFLSWSHCRLGGQLMELRTEAGPGWSTQFKVEPDDGRGQYFMIGRRNYTFWFLESCGNIMIYKYFFKYPNNYAYL